MNDSNVLPDNFPKLTEKSLDLINFSITDIAKIIGNLNPNKAHGQDMPSVRIIKLCRNSICKPLLMIFNDCLSVGKFPSEGKKAKILLLLLLLLLLFCLFYHSNCCW